MNCLVSRTGLYIDAHHDYYSSNELDSIIEIYLGTKELSDFLMLTASKQ